MAVTTYIASSAGTTTAALPAGTLSGDIVVAVAMSSSATAPTLPASWTNITSNTATPASRLQYRVYDGVWTMPTFTGAAQTHVLTIRGQDVASPIGVTSITNGSTTNPVFPAVTLVDVDGSSQLIRSINHTRNDTVMTAPTGHTSRQSSGTQPGWMTCTKNATTDGATATVTVSRNTTWTQSQVEIKCQSVPLSQGTLAMSSASSLTVDAVRTPVQAGTLAMSSTSVLSLEGTVVAGGPATDPDTNAYFAATGLDPSYADPLDRLVLGLKAAGLWSKMTAIYPFIGGTATLHQWNLKDPRNLDDAYRLTYYNAPSTTHSTALGYRANAQGQQANGGYADTHFVPLGVLAQDSTHLSWYGLEDTPPADRAEFGAFNWGGMATSRFHIIARYQGVNAYYYGQSENASTNVGSPAASGLFVTSRTGPTTTTPYRNGVKLGSSAQPSVTLPDRPLWLGAINDFVNRSDIPCGFASIGSGLDDADVTALWAVVETYQSDLGRATTAIGPVTQDADLAMSSASVLSLNGGQAIGVANLPQSFTDPGWTLTGATSTGAKLVMPAGVTSSAKTANLYTLDEQRVFWKVSQAFTVGKVFCGFRQDTQNSVYFNINAGTALLTVKIVGNVTVQSNSIPWDSAQPYLSMRETGGTIFWERSATGQPGSWTAVDSTAAPSYAVDGNPFEFWTSVGPTGNAWIESLNQAGAGVTQGALSLSSTSTFAATAVRDQAAALVLSSTSALTTTAIRAPQGSLAMASASTTTFSAVREQPASTALTSLTALSLAGARTAQPTLAMVATSSMTVVATGIGVQSASVGFSSTSSLSFTGIRAPQGTLAFSASSQLVAGAVVTKDAVVALSSISSFSTDGQRTAQPTLAMVATSSLTVAATGIGVGQGTLSMFSTSTLTVGATRFGVSAGTLAMTAISSLTLTPVRGTSGLLAMTEVSSLSIVADRTPQGVLAMTTRATLVLAGVRGRWAQLALVATSTLTSGGQQFAPGLPNASHTGSLQTLDADGLWYPVKEVGVHFYPSSLSGLVTWLDAADYAAGTWLNKGSGAAVRTVGTPVMTAGVPRNGHPTVRFTVNEGRIRGDWPYPIDDWTVLYTMRWVGPGVGRTWTVCYPPSNLLIGAHTSGQDAAYFNGAWLGPNGGGTVAWGTGPGTWKLYEGDGDSTSATVGFYINGTAYGRYTSGSNLGLTNGWGLSGYDPLLTQETLDMEVGELCIYNRRLADAERVQVEGYLNEKWALT